MPLHTHIFPGGFTGCKHTADSSNNKTDEREAPDNEPPLVIANQRCPGIEQCTKDG